MKCPNCDSEDFYIEPAGEVIFVKIRNDRTVISKNTCYEKQVSRDDLVVFCTQCAWYGIISELVESV